MQGARIPPGVPNIPTMMFLEFSSAMKILLELRIVCARLVRSFKTIGGRTGPLCAGLIIIII